jgi:hypothetical protein
MEAHQLDNAAVHAKKEKSNWWWPKTDSLEHARDAAKGGSIAFGLIAFSRAYLWSRSEYSPRTK